MYNQNHGLDIADHPRVEKKKSSLSTRIGLRMNPENPFNSMTDKDCLLYNPIYSNYLMKLNKLDQ